MKKSDRSNTLAWLRKVTGRKKGYLLILLILQVTLGISSVGYALQLRNLVNAAVSGEVLLFWQAVAGLAFLLLFQVVVRAVNRFVEEVSRSSLENCLKGRLFASLLSRDYASVTQIHSGEWMNRLTSDTVVTADGLTYILPGVAGMAVKMVGALIAIIYLEYRFLYILLPGGILLLLLTTVFRKVLKRLHKNIQEADGKLRVFWQERLSSLMIVHTFSQEKGTIEEAGLRMEHHKRARMNRNVFSNLCNTGFSLAINGAYVLGAVFCGYGILKGTMSYGNLMAILQLIGQIQNPFANITGYLPKYYAMLASAERLMEVESFDPIWKGKKYTKEEMKHFYSDHFQGLELDKVSFTYQPPVQTEANPVSMPQVISGFDLKIEKGEYVALTGPSGCGKSTILKLLMCLYPLKDGYRNLLTDEGKKELTSEWLSLFAYVPQGNQLLSGSIREIITFGDEECMQKEEAVWLALDIACAKTFVEKLEEGLDAELGEHGTGLSEGQMQRIAIARAVFSERPILLLDEVTERQLLKNLRQMTDRTVVIVTHRPAVLEAMDKQIKVNLPMQERQEK